MRAAIALEFPPLGREHVSTAGREELADGVGRSVAMMSLTADRPEARRCCPASSAGSAAKPVEERPRWASSRRPRRADRTVRSGAAKSRDGKRRAAELPQLQVSACRPPSEPSPLLPGCVPPPCHPAEMNYSRTLPERSSEGERRVRCQEITSGFGGGRADEPCCATSVYGSAVGASFATARRSGPGKLSGRIVKGTGHCMRVARVTKV